MRAVPFLERALAKVRGQALDADKRAEDGADGHRARRAVAADFGVGAGGAQKVAAVLHNKVHRPGQRALGRACFAHFDGLRPPNIPKARHGRDGQVVEERLLEKVRGRVSRLAHLVQRLLHLGLDERGRLRLGGDGGDGLCGRQARVDDSVGDAREEFSALQRGGLAVREHGGARRRRDGFLVSVVGQRRRVPHSHGVGHAAQRRRRHAALHLVVRRPRLRADPRPPRRERRLPARHELGHVQRPRRRRRRGQVLRDEHRVVAVVCELAGGFCRPVAVAVVEVAPAPADAVRGASRLLAGRVVRVQLPVKGANFNSVVLVVRRQTERVRDERAEQRPSHARLLGRCTQAFRRRRCAPEDGSREAAHGEHRCHAPRRPSQSRAEQAHTGQSAFRQPEVQFVRD
mmetsp:Transcript_2544/g.9287  ORF Transcript_2544/g.9287 Transcript_2544/m.9287 type:complete len:402 (-) Transcript_2544:14-1219(-)